MENKVHVLTATAGESSSGLVYFPMLFSVPRSKITLFCLPSTLWKRVWHCIKPSACVCHTSLLFASKSDILFPSECDFRDVLKLQELSIYCCFLCCPPSPLPPDLSLSCSLLLLETRTAFFPYWVFWTSLPFSVFGTLLSL